MEWTRTEYLGYMSGERVERPMFVELFGPLVGLEAEWEDQGAREDEIALTAFGFDHVRRHQVAVATGYWPMQPEEVLEETDEQRVVRDGMGRTMKLAKQRATIGLPQDFPVKSESDWARIKPRYEFDEARFASDWVEQACAAHEADALIVARIPGGYDEMRELNRRTLSRIREVVPINQLSVHEDFAGKSGPLVGPNIIDEFIGPYYRAAWEEAAAAGAELFQLDSDGNIAPVIEALMRGGVNSVLPNEPAAGMDMVALREAYGSKPKLVGGIDKFAPRTSREADRALSVLRETRSRDAGAGAEPGAILGADGVLRSAPGITTARLCRRA